MESWLVFFILVPAILRCSETALLPGNLRIETGCYGSDGDILLEPICGSEERIVIDTQYALTKRNDTGCPDVMTTNTSSLTYCCQFNESDCKDIYTGLSMMTYYEKFTGRQTSTLKASQQRMSSCSSDVYGRIYTTYMMLDYFCISENVVASFSDINTSLTGTEVYLLNTEYPDLINVSNSLQECTVSTSCGNNIVITAIDLSFQCLQGLEISDGNDTRNITCSDNTGYNITQIYQSSTNFIKLRLNNGQINGGKIWVQINATTPGVVLTLTCGVTNQTTPAPCTISTTPTTTTATTTTAIPTATSTAVTTSRTSTSDGTAGLDSGILAGIIVCIIILIVLVVILVIVFYIRYRNRRQNRVGVDDNNQNTRSGLPTPSPSSNGLPPPTGAGRNRLPPIPPTEAGRNRLPPLPPDGTANGLSPSQSSGAADGLPSVLTSQAESGLPPVQTM